MSKDKYAIPDGADWNINIFIKNIIMMRYFNGIGTNE